MPRYRNAAHLLYYTLLDYYKILSSGKLCALLCFTSNQDYIKSHADCNKNIIKTEVQKNKNMTKWNLTINILETLEQ